MTKQKQRLRRQLTLLLASSLCAGMPFAVFAADATASATPAATPAPDGAIPTAITGTTPAVTTQTVAEAKPPIISQNVTINLINRLVARGLLSKEDSADLIKQAESDALLAREQAMAVQAALEQNAAAQTSAVVSNSGSITPPVAPKTPETTETSDITAGAAPFPTPDTSSPNAQPGAADAAQPSDVSDDTVRVTYIPEVVKAQLREEIKQEVMQQAKDENWAAPHSYPDWVSRFKLIGDVRVRYQGDYFPTGNDNTGDFPNFNAINTGSPYDASTSNTQLPPTLNVDQDRQRIRLRARFGTDVTLRDNFSAGFRIASGESNTPVSENQSFGAAGSGQGGNFSKYAVWLDRAFIKYEVGGQPGGNLAITAGRFDNPFLSTSIIWADDLAFDGFALQAKYQIASAFTPFLTIGAFPVFNTDLNFSSNQPAKFSSTDKWLYAGQIGYTWKISPEWSFKSGVAFYDFQNVKGQLSDPYTPLTAQDAGNTDNTRPSFAQKGNTYRPLRNIVANASNNNGTIDQFQYYGLATDFQELSLTGRLEFNPNDNFRLSLIGEYVKNLAWNQNDINAVAINNQGANTPAGTINNYAGGDTAWIVLLRLGSPALDSLWDWNLSASYRRVESDAVIDGFVDSDFGGGGTNVEGFTVGGTVALSPDVSFGIRAFNATQVAGPPLKTDTVQVEVNSKF